MSSFRQRGQIGEPFQERASAYSGYEAVKREVQVSFGRYRQEKDSLLFHEDMKGLQYLRIHAPITFTGEKELTNARLVFRTVVLTTLLLVTSHAGFSIPRTARGALAINPITRSGAKGSSSGPIAFRFHDVRLCPLELELIIRDFQS